MKYNYELWSKLPYAGETMPPKNPDEPFAGSWTLNYLKRGKKGFLTPLGKPFKLAIKNPNLIDWNSELKVVQETLNNATPTQIQMAKYWGTGVPTKQWIPIVDRLIDTYGVSAPMAGRIQSALFSTINDAFVVTWYLKFKWNVARPDQLDHELATFICTPRHPTYPSGHAVISGVAETILSYFFPGEAERLNELAEENAASRMYGGVHFKIDDDQGLRLGRQIGRIIVNNLRRQKNSKNMPIDVPYKENLHADLQPPPYDQAIPFDFDTSCESLVIPTYY